MSRKFKTQASSARAASSTFGSAVPAFGATAFQTSSSPLSYVTELPDLERLSDPKVKVTLKNLTKRDGVTKAKALEELLELLSTEGESITEQPFLDAWVEVYPRTSIDNARRVRQLAHTFQGALTARSGKAIAPLLPKITGPWLAGSFDNDKAVSRAAIESIQTAFPSETKRRALWEIYQKPLLGYLQDAILYHTPQTLSDERTTSPDDANAKYARVVSSGLLCVGRLLQTTSTEKSVTGEGAFQDLLANRKIYDFAIHGDAGVRKAFYRLLSDAVEREVALDWSAVSKVVLIKALKLSQLGSSGDYIDTLVAVAESRPLVWTTDLQPKSPLLRNLYVYIQRGSQRGPGSWWPKVARLIKSIPSVMWDSGDSEDENKQLSAYTDLLKAFRDGVGQKDEPRQNLTAAWMAYLDMIFWTLSKFSTQAAQNEIVQSFALHPIQSYLLPTRDSPRLNLPTSVDFQVALASARGLLGSSSASQFSSFYETPIAGLVELMKKSQPQGSENWSTSQDEVITATRRFTQFQLGLSHRETSATNNQDEQKASVQDLFTVNNTHLIEEAVKLLRSRETKPYGSAGLIYVLLERVPTLLAKPEFLSTFLQEKAATLLERPSAEFLVLVSAKYRSIWGDDEAYERLLSEFLQRESLRSTRAYTALLHGLIRKHAHLPEVQNMVLEDLDAALGGYGARWANIQEVLTNKSLTTETPEDVAGADPIQGRVLDVMMSRLSLEESELEALDGFEVLLKSENSKSTIKSSGLNLRQLLQRLIMISHSSGDESAAKASKLLPVLRRAYTETGETSIESSTVTIISSQLDGEEEPLPISSLVALAHEVLTQSKDTNISSIFPTSSQWEKAIMPFLQIAPPPGLALITPLRGCAHLIDQPRRKSITGPLRDIETYSIALRLGIYTTRLLDNVSIDQLPDDQLHALYYYYPLVLQLADDKLNIEGANAMWIHSGDDQIQEISEIATKGRAVINSWTAEERSGEEESEKPSIISLWVTQLQNITETSPQAFHLARAAVTVLSEAPESAISRYRKVWDQLLSQIRNSAHVLKSAATVLVCRDLLDGSAQGSRLVNELVANARDINFEDSQNAIKQLAILNITLDGSELAGNVPFQRLVFVTKHLIAYPSLISSPTVHPGLQAELLRALAHILPALKELYGEYWPDTISLLVDCLKEMYPGRDISSLHSALKLHACLRSLVDSGCNECLEVVFAEGRTELQASFLNILSFFDEAPSGVNQPISITATFLARQVRDLRFKDQNDLSVLYPLLYSDEGSIQQATYSILSRSIPEIQQELSIETALSKTVPHLPEELLSLLLDAPTIDLLHEKSLSPNAVWINLRRYLLAWKITFDHIAHASHVVQSGYVADIKDHGHLDYLLELSCDILRITDNKPLDASKVDVTNFTLDEASSLEKENQWLSMHLYYLSLLHLPSLSKSWFLEQKNRIKIPLEAWSKKHICAHIISASLDNVSAWHATNTTSPDNSSTDLALTLKINPRASELIASISIDPDSPPISLCITLPPTYPLTHALVSSRTRVIVSEQKWQSWLRTIQGIINFPSVTVTAATPSNPSSPPTPTVASSSTTRIGTGGLIDGLIAFQRNVQGALRGQSECAICYSVIGTELKVPDKRCATCKNVYHGDCLYRWFRSSNSSTCPLCRNNFHYA